MFRVNQSDAIITSRSSKRILRNCWTLRLIQEVNKSLLSNLSSLMLITWSVWSLKILLKTENIVKTNVKNNFIKWILTNLSKHFIPVLRDNVKQVNSEQLHGLGEVSVWIISWNCSQHRAQPRLSWLEKLESELCLAEHVHPPQEWDHLQTLGKLDRSSQLTH